MPWLADGPLEGSCMTLACWACRGLRANGLTWFLLCLPHQFTWGLALEGLSHLEVVSVAWDPHPQEPFEGVLWATSVLELAANLADFRAERKMRCAEGCFLFVPDSVGFCGSRVFSSWRGPDSPSSHCLSLRWFRRHVVVLGVGPQLRQPAVLRAFVCFYGGSVSLFRGGEAGARLASRGRGWRVPLLAASGGGLVAVVVTTFPHDVSKCYPLP
ncbi:hypothetical protein Taro_049155 [Colocasia esculenta]|uniref:Uncharacterized protein n=1 Tax=Colocasia esculenta TaxID=4460 RepID=A0A843XA53_COLES|nr:hypothetical protein [Colocasia esculenta]